MQKKVDIKQKTIKTEYESNFEHFNWNIESGFFYFKMADFIKKTDWAHFA